ncbi:MAG TPA: hypothetical protein VN655_09800 [Pseudolabrys sp.]|nr:hypothetical protein [Pseudolabrys sp.]
MHKLMSPILALAAGLTLVSTARAAEWTVISDKTVSGFGHNESVAYDAREKVFYAGDFGPALKPADKDGKGKITKLSMDGKVLKDGIFPANGEVMNKPKGIWIKGRNLWVTDIDVLWQFDLKTKKSKKLDLPVNYANDPALIGNSLYVSDNRNDKVLKITPADFLNAKKPPKIEVVYSGKGVFPNGLWPAKGGGLLMGGFQDKDHPKAIYSLKPGQDPKALTKDIGLIDGLYQTKDGDIIATDWVSTSLFVWNKKSGMKTLVTGIKGPADFCVVPNKQGLLIAQPDLVQGQIRLIQLSKK